MTDDNDLVTHGLHWLTLGPDGWQCANPDCAWVGYNPWDDQALVQNLFDFYHARIVRARG